MKKIFLIISILFGFSFNMFSQQNIIQENDDKTSIYPNPFVDVIHVEVENLKTIQIYDIQGHLIYKFESYYTDYASFDLNLSRLHGGFYILNIVTIDSKEYKKKIIKRDTNGGGDHWLDYFIPLTIIFG